MKSYRIKGSRASVSALGSALGSAFGSARRVAPSAGMACLVLAAVSQMPAWGWGAMVMPAPAPAPVAALAAPAPAPAPSAMSRPGSFVASAPGGLLQIDAPPAQAIAPSGFGNSVPLRLALKMLVPSDWISGETGVSADTLVSWHGGQSWPQALSEIARQNHWTIVLDWGGHTVTVEMAQARQQARPAPARGAVPVAARHVAHPAPVFVLKKGQPILAQLKQWAAKSNWTLVSTMPAGQDWEASNDAVYSGTFYQAATKVLQDLESNLSALASPVSIHAHAHLNTHTIVVTSQAQGN